MPRKVLHFFKTFFPDTHGGIERVIHDVCAGLPLHGWRGEVLALSHAPTAGVRISEAYDLTQVRRAFSVASTDVSLAAIPAFARAARRAEVINFHFPWPMMDIANLLIRSRIPYIVTYHSDIVKQARMAQVYKPLMHHLLGNASRIIATSHAYRETSPVLARYRDRTEVIPLGTTPVPATEAARSEVAQRFQRPYVVFVGVLRYYKGLHVLLRAARGLDLDIVIAGEGPERARLERDLASQGLTNVYLTGFVADPVKTALIEGAMAVVLPSHLRSEAFGVALIEGAAAGKPLISCEIGTGTSYINLSGVTGFVVPPDDAEALAAALRQLAADSALRARFGAAAKARYTETFTAAAMVRAYATLYDVVQAEAAEKTTEKKLRRREGGQ